ncbi:transposase, MuDR, MULE transposase domain protein [Tanacetum coccineum]
MLDNIPFDIKMAIMNLLLEKSLLQFRTVSKQWKFSIDNFDFIRNYGCRERNSCCFNLSYKHDIQVASSEGVWCFAYGKNSNLLLWKPSIKKSVRISVPNYTFQPDSPKMIFGFGIRLVTLEPTLLKINYPLYTDGPCFDFGDCRIIYAWALEVEGGFISSCRLLFTIPHPASHYLKLLGFSKDKEPIVEATIVHQWYRSLHVFHPTIQYFQNISVKANRDSFFIGPYKESLVLHTERNENPQPNYHKWEKFMSFKPDIPETPLYKSKPMISKQYKKETDIKVGNIFDNKEALELAIRLKALDKGYQFLSERSGPKRCDTLKGSIQGKKSVSCGHGWKQPDCANCFWYMQRRNRHAAIALAVQNEFPLAFHAAYTTEEFSTEMSNLQDVQPDAYHKLCEAGPQRWSRAHCPLVRYSYMASNSMESINACTVLYRKLPVLKLAETYHVMVQDWYFKRRELIDWFKKEKYQGTYAESIHFLGNMQEWEFPHHIQKAIPHRMDNPQPGRPKNTNRIRSQGEEPRVIRCTRCSQAGRKHD